MGGGHDLDWSTCCQCFVAFIEGKLIEKSNHPRIHVESKEAMHLKALSWTGSRCDVSVFQVSGVALGCSCSVAKEPLSGNHGHGHGLQL